MSAFDLRLAHKCSQEKAQQCIGAWLLSLKEQQARWIEGASVTWEGTTANFQIKLRTPLGIIPASGTLRVEASMFCFQGELPWRARPFRGMVQSVMSDALTAKCKDCCAC